MMGWSKCRRLLRLSLDGLGSRWHLLALAFALAMLDLGAVISMPLLGATAVDALMNRNGPAFRLSVLSLAGLAAARIVFTAITMALVVNVQEGWGHRARRRLAGAMLRRPARFLQRRPTGDLLSRLLHDSAALKTVPTAVMLQGAVDVLTLLAAGGLLLHRHPLLALLTILGAPLPLALPWLTRRHLENASAAVRCALAELTSRCQSWLSRPLALKVHRLEETAGRACTSASDRYAAASRHLGYLSALVQAATGLLAQVPGVVILTYGGTLVLQQRLSLGDLFAFTGLAALFEPPLQRILGMGAALPALFPPQRRLRPFWNGSARISPGLSRRYPVTHLLNRPIHGLSVQSLSVHDAELTQRTAGGRTWRLRIHHFSVSRDTISAISGPPGSGKSTLARHLAGVDTPRRGAIRLFDPQGRVLTGISLRQAVGLSMQEPVVHPGTIVDNVTLFARRPDRKRAAEVLHRTGLGPWLNSRPHGLQTSCNVGVPLSSGQMRMLELARLLYRRPPVWILDEPGHHLDSAGHTHLINLLQQAACRHIIILVTHQPELLAICRNVCALPAPGPGATRAVVRARKESPCHM